MKKINFFPNIIVFCSSLLFLACEPRNVTEAEEPPIPQGERLFSPDWELTEDLDGSDVTALELSFNSYIIAAASSGNFFRTKNNGDSWTLIPAANNPVTIVHRSNNFLYAGTLSGELFYSEANGRLWELMRNFGERINAIITANDSSIILATSSGLFRSEDNGQIWNTVSTGISPDRGFFSLILLNGGILLAGSDNGLYTSMDNGLSWSLTDFSETCYTLAQSYHSALFAGTVNGVFRSDDDGKNWFQVGLSNERIISLAVTKAVHIFAGTNSKGIFYSHNNGYSWTNFGLSNKTVSAILDVWLKDMILAAADNKVYRITANN